MLGAFVLLVTVIGVAGTYLWWRNESLWDYGRKRIAAEISDPETRGITLTMAGALHLKAVDLVVPRDLRGRRGLSMPDPVPYYDALQALIREDLARMDRTLRVDEKSLAGFWESRSSEDAARYVVHLKTDGTYRDAAVTGRGDDEVSSIGEGTWAFKQGVLMWRETGGKDDPNRMVRGSDFGFILKEADGSYSYFRRITPRPSLAEKLR